MVPLAIRPPQGLRCEALVKWRSPMRVPRDPTHSEVSWKQTELMKGAGVAANTRWAGVGQEV